MKKDNIFKKWWFWLIILIVIAIIITPKAIKFSLFNKLPPVKITKLNCECINNIDCEKEYIATSCEILEGEICGRCIKIGGDSGGGSPSGPSQ